MTPTLTCPYCQHRFPLTYLRYFKAGFGRHDCPACGLRSKTPHDFRYFSLLTLNTLVVLVLPTIWWTGWPEISDRRELILPFLVLTPIALFVDRQISGRARGLVPIPGQGDIEPRATDERPVKPLDYENPYEPILHDDD